jgi:alpha-tubulin suppressor-like RCC1 family protein
VVEATKAYVWGYNNTGELGLGHAARVFTPTPARLPKGVVDVQGGANFSVALTSSGKVLTWGSNEHGQLGDGSREPRHLPGAIGLPRRAKAAAIAAGTDHVVVLTRDGDVVTWGRNHRGQLGLGNRRDQLRPKRVDAGRIRRVAAGDGISAAISTSGRLVVWGRNGAHQLGLKRGGSPDDDVLEPARSSLVTARVSAVDAGLRHLVVLTSAGQVLTFGTDGQGKPLERRVDLLPAWGRVRSISAGEDHTVALTSHGLVLGWGANDRGQVGVGSERHHPNPVVVTVPGRVKHLRAGHRHTLAVTTKGEVYAWGEGGFGAVGVGRPKLEATAYEAPQQVRLPGVRPTGLGGGGYGSVVFVDQGPAARLRLNPPRHSEPGQVRLGLRTVDAFGTDLGPAPGDVSITVRGGTVVRTTRTRTSVTLPTPGPYTVVARAGHLIGRTTLHVQAPAGKEGPR